MTTKYSLTSIINDNQQVTILNGNTRQIALDHAATTLQAIGVTKCELTIDGANMRFVSKIPPLALVLSEVLTVARAKLEPSKSILKQALPPAPKLAKFSGPETLDGWRLASARDSQAAPYIVGSVPLVASQDGFHGYSIVITNVEHEALSIVPLNVPKVSAGLPAGRGRPRGINIDDEAKKAAQRYLESNQYSPVTGGAIIYLAQHNSFNGLRIAAKRLAATPFPKALPVVKTEPPKPKKSVRIYDDGRTPEQVHAEQEKLRQQVLSRRAAEAEAKKQRS